MRAADSSVAVAAFAGWHPGHRAARASLGSDAHIVGHAALETYSVLTRLPSPFRATPGAVREFLIRRFPDDFLTLEPPALREALSQLTRHGIEGGAAYDGLIAMTAHIHDAILLSLDRRATVVYDRLQVRYELVAA